MPEVYVAGFEFNGTVNVAKIWKNGVATSLTNGINDALAASVFISGSDVYVAGEEESAPAIYNAKLWKNSTALPLTNSVDAGGTSVFVLGQMCMLEGIKLARPWRLLQQFGKMVTLQL